MKISITENKLRSLFLRNAKLFDKKHGKWAIFRFEEEETFLCMDTWNGAFYYKKGSGEYSYWNGFEGEAVYYFGCNEQWQASDPRHTPDNVFEFYIEKMEKKINKEKINEQYKEIYN